ncbi:hypothetical protein CEE45_13215 [Candidatus Heimdallarchaeota archaeon B3_Heim]|nr:MAG: hypothetical protein CEE45_13215 [Candidatus Heimdallarchaeota archaeon B3_Heim]
MLIHGPDSKLDLKNALSSSTRNNFISGLKGRMVLTLIELANLYPYETNHTSLCKILSIPPSTLSNQIKKLIELDYLESSNSPKLMYDARYRNYRITMKGISFLHVLKEVLDSSVRRLEELASIELLNERFDEKLIAIYSNR